mgnify:CR=1 FL=1
MYNFRLSLNLYTSFGLRLKKELIEVNDFLVKY